LKTSRNSSWTKKPRLLFRISPGTKTQGQDSKLGWAERTETKEEAKATPGLTTVRISKLGLLERTETKEEAKATPDLTTVRISKLGWRY
jgi:hypothetical protein